jgi:hypothetical protein
MGRPGPDDWSEDAGQWRGVAVQIHRWIAGVLHEVMVVIQKNRHVLKTSEAQSVIDSLTARNRTIWEQLVVTALDKTGKTATLLERVRDNAAFHYGPKDLGLGYRKQFEVDAKERPHVANLTAQFSFGKDMDATRFFFADAAAQQRMSMLGLQFGAPETDRRIVELAGEVNDAIVPLVLAFIHARSGVSTPAR